MYFGDWALQVISLNWICEKGLPNTWIYYWWTLIHSESWQACRDLCQPHQSQVLEQNLNHASAQISAFQTDWVVVCKRYPGWMWQISFMKLLKCLMHRCMPLLKQILHGGCLTLWGEVPITKCRMISKCFFALEPCKQPHCSWDHPVRIWCHRSRRKTRHLGNLRLEAGRFARACGFWFNTFQYPISQLNIQ